MQFACQDDFDNQSYWDSLMKKKTKDKMKEKE